MTVERAKSTIPSLLNDVSKGTVRFRHISFSTITLGLYAEVLRAALERHVIVGVGLNYSELSGDNNTWRHILRVVREEPGDHVLLYDDSKRGLRPSFLLDWQIIERAVRGIDDGYWMIGNRGSLTLPYTLPE